MPGSNKACEARHQGGNEMRCDRCDLLWDTDDPEPPKCLTKTQANHKRGRAHLKRIRESLPNE